MALATVTVPSAQSKAYGHLTTFKKVADHFQVRLDDGGRIEPGIRVS
jgi:hypothetical protein